MMMPDHSFQDCISGPMYAPIMPLAPAHAEPDAAAAAPDDEYIFGQLEWALRETMDGRYLRQTPRTRRSPLARVHDTARWLMSLSAVYRRVEKSPPTTRLDDYALGEAPEFPKHGAHRRLFRQCLPRARRPTRRLPRRARASAKRVYRRRPDK